MGIAVTFAKRMVNQKYFVTVNTTLSNTWRISPLNQSSRQKFCMVSSIEVTLTGRFESLPISRLCILKYCLRLRLEGPSSDLISGLVVRNHLPLSVTLSITPIGYPIGKTASMNSKTSQIHLT